MYEISESSALYRKIAIITIVKEYEATIRVFNLNLVEIQPTNIPPVAVPIKRTINTEDALTDEIPFEVYKRGIKITKNSSKQLSNQLMTLTLRKAY